MNAQLRPQLPGRRLLCNALRFLAIDAVERAGNGHPGMPMGMAEIAEALWRGYLKHDPADPHWVDRDRFVLSNGHGSMLLYALLHLTGYDLPLEELKRFRQLHSKTPGHPEFGVTPGVETTTGPLGQGLANAVGMALAESLLAAEFNRPGHAIVDHRTWVFVGDGCLMEGISHEACSLAGTLGLSKLVAIYDDNGISIDGHVEHWFTDDTPARFEAYGWRVIRDVPGHGSPHKADTHEVHGAALGAAEVAATRAHLGWTAVPFEIPPEIRAAWDATTQGAARHTDWRRRFAAYAAAHPELAAEFERRVCRRELPAHWQDSVGSMLAAAVSQAAAIASRKASQNVIEALQPVLPELLGGSADLTGSNLTAARGSVAVRRGRRGNHIKYGVREFGMSALMNGIALHGGYLPYGGTFLTFSDYSRNAVRMSALMRQRVIYVFTHDSIGLGEDGPTHQPVEHAASLRLIPNNAVWRPSDAVETVCAWQAAIERRDGPTCLLLSRQNLPHFAAGRWAWQAAIERRDGPTCLLLSRQNLPHFARSVQQLDDIRRGGYVLAGGDGPAAITLLATGSEVDLAMRARETLAAEGIAARVVSMPNCAEFDRQTPEYRGAVLPRALPVLAIEAGVSGFWRAYTGFDGDVLGIDRFGESAPAAQVAAALGLTREAVCERARALVRGARSR